MARKPRNEVEPGIFHVHSRGVNKELVFRDEVDKRTYLTILGQVVEEFGWRCYAYCLMENHVHLLIETREPNLGRGMQKLHGRYGSAFNVRHGRVGHVFQGRFGSVPITTDEQFWWVVAYIVGNPVEAGLCETPEQWKWASHRLVLAERPPAWLDVRGLLEYFSGSGGEPLRRYMEMVGTEGTVPAS
jgi:putative transposase